MPRIKPFRGVRPGPDYAPSIVLEIENLSLDQAKTIREHNPYSYVNMLVPKLDNKFLMGSKKELVFKKINENFEEFIDKGLFIRDELPAIYVYQIDKGGITQTGIWTLTSIDDYLNNVVRKHELTRADREQSLVNYLQQTGIDANPVLITYKPLPFISEIIETISSRIPVLSFSKNGAKHILWKIDEASELDLLINAFAEMPFSYIADGHHRAAASAIYGIERRRLNFKHRGDEEYNFFTSVYMSTDQLKVLEFNRLVRDLNGLSENNFLDQLAKDFTVTPGSRPFVESPKTMHQFSIYMKSGWYMLEAKAHCIAAEEPVDQLDVSILQQFLLSPILKINDPRTDDRISFAGGVIPVDELVLKVDVGEFALAIIMFPTTVQQLIQVADAGEVMPPKSTWFEPKFQVGLLIHQLD